MQKQESLREIILADERSRRKFPISLTGESPQGPEGLEQSLGVAAGHPQRGQDVIDTVLGFSGQVEIGVIVAMLVGVVTSSTGSIFQTPGGSAVSTRADQVKGHRSDQGPDKNGVGQGSILGPQAVQGSQPSGHWRLGARISLAAAISTA